MNSNTQWCLLTVVGCLAGFLAATIQPLASVEASRVLSVDESTLAIGGCPNKGCVDKTCKTTGCSFTDLVCTRDGDTKCRKIAKNNYARCGAEGSRTGYSCEETEGAGCVTKYAGDQEPGEGSNPGTCPEANCKADGSCGPKKYTCKADSCE